MGVPAPDAEIAHTYACCVYFNWHTREATGLVLTARAREQPAGALRLESKASQLLRWMPRA